MTEVPPSEFCGPHEASTYTGVSEATLEAHRSRGTGPRFYRVGRLIKYTYDDLRTWMTANPVEPQQ